MMKEFLTSESDQPVKFKVHDDVYVAVAPCDLPGNVLVRYAETVAMGRVYSAHLMFFEAALEEESFETFQSRLDKKRSAENPAKPITLNTMAEVANWLIEEIYAGKAKGLL